MKVQNRVLFEASNAMSMLADLKPKRGLFGFKFALVQKFIQPFASSIGEGMNEILMRHVKRDDKEQPVIHESGRGYALENVEAYNEDVTTLLDTEVEVAGWPPTVFTPEDIDKAEIEIPNRAYLLLGPLLGSV